jgi:hypothetical protein
MPDPSTPKLLPGHEYISGNEDAIAAAMVNELEAQLDRLYADRRVLRQIHTKMHGCVKASFAVESGLPEELRVGVFSQERTYHAWVRFSNANTVPKPDRKKDVRGIAIKLMDVPGDKILNEEHLQQTQDFLLMNTETFFSRNIKEFSGLLSAVTAPRNGKLKLLGYAIAHWPVMKRVLASNIRCSHPFAIPYWSTQPYQFGGPGIAVKYHLRPSSWNRLVIENEKDDDFLRVNMAQTLNSHEAAFDFCVQFQTDADKMPIEDPTVPWGSPYIKLASLTIPPQEFDTREQMEFGDNLSFNSWHSLPVHRPLGSFNRVRKRVYEALSHYRHKRNQEPLFEPKDSLDFMRTHHEVRSSALDVAIPATGVKKVSASVLVDGDKQTAFRFISSGSQLPKWLKKAGPVSGARATSVVKGPYDHDGAIRKVEFENGDSVQEEIIKFDPYVSYAYRVTAFTNFFRKLTDTAYGELWFDRYGEKTRITWVYAYAYKNFFAGLFITLFNALVFRKFMQKGLERARILMDEAD